jgi:hypothetical protein
MGVCGGIWFAFATTKERAPRTSEPSQYRAILIHTKEPFALHKGKKCLRQEHALPP